MTIPVEHIQPDELRQFLNGDTLDDARNQTIENHLRNCSVCQSVAEDMPADALQKKLRSLHESDDSGVRLADRYQLLNEERTYLQIHFIGDSIGNQEFPPVVIGQSPV